MQIRGFLELTILSQTRHVGEMNTDENTVAQSFQPMLECELLTMTMTGMLRPREFSDKNPLQILSILMRDNLQTQNSQLFQLKLEC
jgi:hypothetical protein